MRTSKELKAEAAKLIHEIQSFRNQHREEWNAGYEAELKEKKDAFTKLQADIEAAESFEKDDVQFKEYEEFYTKPANESQQFSTKKVESGSTQRSKEELEAIKMRATAEFIRGSNKNDEAAKRHAAKVLKQEFGITPQETYTLMEGDDALGGAWVVPEFKSRIIEALPALSQVVNLVRREPTSSDEAQYPLIALPTGDNASIASSDVSAEWVTDDESESDITAATTQDEPGTGMVSIKVNMLRSKLIKISYRLQQDARADIVGISQRLLSQAFALALESALISGSGVNRPTGILTTLGDSQKVITGDANELTYLGICRLVYGVNDGYAASSKAAFLMKRSEMAKLLTIEDNGGRFVYQPNVAPGQLLGYPIHTSPYMPSVAANNYPIIFGDFDQYILADRAEMMILIYREVFAPNIGIRAMARLGGKLSIADSFRKLKVSAS